MEIASVVHEGGSRVGAAGCGTGVPGGPPKRSGVAPGSSGPSPELLDLRVIGSLIALSSDAPGFMTELVAEFRQGTRRHLATLRRAAASGDADAMVFAAHTLRGNSGTIGARRVFALASKVEELAAAACTEEASTLIAPLETEYERIQGALDAAVAAGEAATSAS